MNKEEKEVQQAFLDSEKQTMHELKQAYKQALADCNEKIRLLSARADMNPPELQSIIYQKNYQQAIKGQLEGIMANLQSNEYATISDYLTRCYQEGYIGTMYDLAGQGIPLIIPIDQEKVSKAIQIDSKLKEDLYKELGEDVNKLKASVRAEISRGIANGSSWNDVAANLALNFKNTPFNTAYNRSATIARTEGHRIQIQSALDAQKEAKKKGADVVKQWDSTLDGKTRESHRKLDGQIRELDEDFEVDGMKAEAPGMFGDPAEDCNCRCALLQRAKWALDEEELETLRERATFHGMLVDDSKEFGHEKAKDFSDFKEKYLGISKEDIEGADSGSVRSNAQKISKNVYALKEYEIDGITYKVDGKHVVLDITQNEKDVAQLVGSYLGKEVEIIPRIVFPQGISTPDYVIGGKKYDLKEPLSNGKHAFYNMINKKKKQADNFIFDISKSSIADDAISDQIKDVYGSSHTLFVNNIIVVKNGKVIDTFDRNK